MTDEILTTAEVAALLKAPPATLRFWRHKEMGPPCFVLGRRVVYRAADVDQWVADQEAATRRGGGITDRRGGQRPRD